MKVNDVVAVSTINGTKFGRVVTKNKKKVTVNVGGNVVTAEVRHVTKVHENKLLKKLNKTL
jgi:hypothetical protein